MGQGIWQPVLTGDLAKRAAEAVDDIRADLAAQRDVSTRADLSVGPIGRSLFFAYSAEALDREDDLTSAGALIDRAIERVAEERGGPLRGRSLHRGFVGVAWALAHLSWCLEESDNDFNLEIDHTLLDDLKREPWPGHYNLRQGLVGLGVYALERLPRRAPHSALELVVKHLDATAQRVPDGVTWYTPPELLHPAEQREFRAREGFCGLGLASGVAGVIAFLARVCPLDIATDRVRPLLKDAIRWLLPQCQTEGTKIGFPYAVAPGETPRVARLAWCNGDLGISVALLQAARALADGELERVAIAIAHRIAERPAAQSEVLDACLCHGAAGAGHLFNRLWQATGEPLLRRAAETWFERALEMRRPRQGFGGFQTWERNAWLHGGPDGPKSWVDDPGLLAGSAGIGLALLAAITSVEPAWDRVLLTAIPPQTVP